VKNKEGKLLTNQTTVIVDITICKTTLVRAADQYSTTTAYKRLESICTLKKRLSINCHGDRARRGGEPECSPKTLVNQAT
jgi:hypothetical protein